MPNNYSTIFQREKNITKIEENCIRMEGKKKEHLFRKLSTIDNEIREVFFVE